ncbi:hypothetical protein P43SY_007609 [Pythium insidiosum]|uniref:Uncharacterized protein n=1 Tax=Pythium insidiosum TaxID=114742 RepID=A0AAD5LJW1_PYTIN|nr:hypothetical protein P43SY_007609 [Pythium insidiosum]
MGSYLSIVNNTPDVWMCKVGPDEAALKIAGIIVAVIGSVAAVIASAGAAAPIAAFLTANGVVSLFGISTSALLAVTSAAASVSTVATAIGSTSGFGMVVARSLANHLGDKGYWPIPAGEKATWGKMTLSLWQQSVCTKTIIADPKTVRTETVYMRPIFSGSTADSNRDHNIQWWVNKNGVEAESIVANAGAVARSLEAFVTDSADLAILIFPNGTIVDALDGHEIDPVT